jgi:hypothetical protein
MKSWQEGAARKNAMVADFMQNLFKDKKNENIDLQNSQHLVWERISLLLNFIMTIYQS